jgi:short-subunit dehydrogenase
MCSGMPDSDQPRLPDLSQFSLEGRTAVITGASRNIGAALAMGFAMAGADLVLVARDPRRLAAHADAVRARTGRRVRAVALDITATDAADHIAIAAAASPGTVDILVNNAFTDGSVHGPIVDTPESVWQEVLATNLIAPVRLSSRFAQTLAESGNG